ncbi:MAG: type II toxin-antitoxin system PemK/MazF family toxin [Solobacterium sp.]|nr:type II toxin-antitoxin system PemK/MazF family toxin [Solobacterium sp.]
MNYDQISNALLENRRIPDCYEVPAGWSDYVESRRTVYGQFLPNYLQPNMRSEAMWVLRGKCHSGEEVGIYVHRGDICWMDFGQSFLEEMGYQHFGLVMALCNKKALVIPMTSNKEAFIRSEEKYSHLMRIGQPEGLDKPSTLFLNDLRFINTARILKIRSRIDPESGLFQEIQKRVIDLLIHDHGTKAGI